MRLAIIGLGRMGANIARRLLRGQHDIIAFDRDPKAVEALVDVGAVAANSLEEVVARLEAQRIFWIMLPAGEATETTIETLSGLGSHGDVIVDGGNSSYRDDIRRGKACAERGLHYVDVGTSGGVWGLDRGYCMMIGGDNEIVARLNPIFDTLAPGQGDIVRTKGRHAPYGSAERGYLHVGPTGSGHFVKMVHNGIEYGLMQAYAEGFDILRARANDELDTSYALNLSDIAEVWRRGSVISSWLLDLSATALAQDHQLDRYSGKVADSGKGQWAIDAAMEERVPAYVMSAALFARYRSRTNTTFGDKLLSAMRFGFGGHIELSP